MFKLLMVGAALMASLATMFTIVVVLFLNLLSSGAEPHERFFTATATNDPQQLVALLDERLTNEIDEPVLAVWMASLNRRLGAAKNVQVTSVNCRTEENGNAISTKAIVTFERGEMMSSLELLNGKIVSFDMQSDKMKNWLDTVPATIKYEQLGKTFINAMLSGNAAEARELMHPNLQKNVTAEQLDAMIEQLAGSRGAVKGVTLRDTEWQGGDAPTMLLNYDIQSVGGTATAEIKIQFAGMRGHLVGFNFQD